MRFRMNLFGLLYQNFPGYWTQKPYSKQKGKCRNTKLLRDKVAIITGGAGAIGSQLVKECLRKGARGVTIADINRCEGERAAGKFCEEYGKDRCIYIHCDVTKSELLDWSFKCTLKHFGQLDLVVNNAGILCDTKWQHSIATNIGGCVIGSLLAIQYMSKTCIGRGGVVVNISSVYGIMPLCGLPIYSMTNAAIISFSKALGEGSQYDRTGVRIITYCVGPTDTPMLCTAPECTMNDKFKVELLEELQDVQKQPSEKVGKGLSKIIRHGRSGSVWVACDGYPPFEICLPDDVNEMKS